ncbi:DUF493 domain-containing protein [candidate division KSB1 bacterium]|nr:DUF493 domain-containing protein [candidate division KSB1 bacterium]
MNISKNRDQIDPESIVGNAGQKPHIDYPCIWTYRIIVSDIQTVRPAIDRLLQGFDYRLSDGLVSRQKKYHSFSLQVQVASEDDRLFIYKALGQCEDIHYIL